VRWTIFENLSRPRREETERRLKTVGSFWWHMKIGSTTSLREMKGG
jgi:hypothetical protein